MREKLLDIAIDHFGRLGFEGAATRSIAAAADTAMSSITYHFGGKEGLYLACAEHIASSMWGRIGPMLSALKAQGATDREAATSGICLLLSGFARIMIDPASAPWARFIAREQQSPTEAFEKLYSGAMKHVVETVIALIQTARPDLTHPQVRATAISLWGQALVLRMGRASACRIMGVEDLDPQTADLLVGQFIANTRHILEHAPETAL